MKKNDMTLEEAVAAGIPLVAMLADTLVSRTIGTMIKDKGIWVFFPPYSDEPGYTGHLMYLLGKEHKGEMKGPPWYFDDKIVAPAKEPRQIQGVRDWQRTLNENPARREELEQTARRYIDAIIKQGSKG